jgi:subtilase family serine protease
LLLSSSSSSAPAGYGPAQIRHAYGFDAVTLGNGKPATGSNQTIAIVDAFSDPNIAGDLATFDATYGLPAPPSFRVMQPEGAAPADPNWSLEISLDVEWAHSIAPGANILLVEARSNSLADLYNAVNAARQAYGVSVVSMSFGAPEVLMGSAETVLDGVFTTPPSHRNVTFIASSGDAGAAPEGWSAEWPAASPNVVGVGGTTLVLDSNNNNLLETAWSGAAEVGSGGGISVFEAEPSYQQAAQLTYQNSTASSRTVPDVAMIADPETGVALYDSYQQSGWVVVGGTSAGAPMWSGLIALADQGRAWVGRGTLDGPGQTLPALYSPYSATDVPTTAAYENYTTYYHDITEGSNGYPATVGYDLVTGLGSPHANQLVPLLVATTAAPAPGVSIPTPSGSLLTLGSFQASDTHAQAATTPTTPSEVVGGPTSTTIVTTPGTRNVATVFPPRSEVTVALARPAQDTTGAPLRSWLTI